MRNIRNRFYSLSRLFLLTGLLVSFPLVVSMAAQGSGVNPANKAMSDAYRREQAYRLEKAQQEAQQRRMAVAAYNEGVDLSNQQRTGEAIAAYRKAIALDSSLSQAYNNLADLLLRSNQYDETVKLYREAIALNPKDPLPYRNLGVLYERMGKIQQSMSAYEDYLKHATQPDPPIQSIVDNYRRSRAAGKATPDYVANATNSSQGEVLIWPSHSNPIRVFVRPGRADQNYARPIIQKCLVDWEAATDGRLRFLPVASPEGANILITLLEGPLTDPTTHVGRAEYIMPEEQLREHRLSVVQVTLNTGNAESRRALPPDSLHTQFYRMALHELGHSIGIWGHSPDPGDVMFAHPIAEHLSERDIRTIRRLYGLQVMATRVP